jgi:hypothetical protein
VRAHAAFPLLAAAALLAAATPAHATGPLANCASGRPWVWPEGGAQIPFHTDLGNLGPHSNAAAVGLVQSAFDIWAAVPTSTASYVHAGPLPEDVDASNFAPYYDPEAPDGLSAVVFDETGEIFELLFGADSGILGFAGPEWGYVYPWCEVIEGTAFLNGAEFTDPTYAFDVMVHEFGHYTGLGHAAVNGQLFLGDASGPSPHDTFGSPADISVIETMYPFYFGPGSGTGSLAADDIAGVSTLYPPDGFFAATGSIAGTVYDLDGLTRRSGVNVIARNLAHPFEDAVSALSGDYTDSTSQDDPVVGTYVLNGLTPGATYAVYVDEIFAGAYSTPTITLPGPEEFYSGAAESDNVASADPPADFVGVAAAAGQPATGIDVILNAPRENDPLKLPDDGSKRIPLPFPYSFCGREYESVYINSNGTLTFDHFDQFVSGHPFWMFVDPTPRIAGLWTDLVPNRSGAVTYDSTRNTFSVSFTNVAEYPNVGSNTFRITLHRQSRRIDIEYGGLTATGGLAGIACGRGLTSAFENEVDLSGLAASGEAIAMKEAAVYEYFADDDNDLDGLTLRFRSPKEFRDRWEPNDSFADARRVKALPFSTLDEFTAIDPVGDDIDYYEVRLEAGSTFVAETLGLFQWGGHMTSFNTLLGLFDQAGNLLHTNDDAGNGSQFSRLRYPVFTGGTYYLGVTAGGDGGFTGDGRSGGRYVLTLSTISGTELTLDDDDFLEVPLPFAFPFQGRSHTSVFVNSNGSLTFGAGDIEYQPTVAAFLSGPPRIAPFWSDLAPMYGGTIVMSEAPGAWTVEFRQIPEIGTISITDTTTFAVTLTASGAIEVRYGRSSGSLIRRLVGITPGGGAADPGETDLSLVSGALPAGGTTYEYFGSAEFDLDHRTLTFVP